MVESLTEAKVGSDGTIKNDEILKAITQLKSEKEVDHERNMLDMTQVDDYKSPWKYKDASTVNDSAVTFLNEYEDDISDSDKKVEASKEPIKDTHVHDTSVGTTHVDSVVTGVIIIGQGGPMAISGGSITQYMIHGGNSIISSNVIMHVLTDSSKMILKSHSFPFKSLESKMIMIAPLTEPFLTSYRDVHASSEIEDSRSEHDRIGTPFVNKKIWGGDHNFSVHSDVGKADKLDTAVQRSLTDERNTVYLRIEEGSLESICPKTIKESNSSEQLNLANSLSIETPKLVSFGYPTMQTDNVGHPIGGIVANRVVEQNRI